MVDHGVALPVLFISEHHRSSPSVQSAVGMESIDLFLSSNHENGVLPARNSVEGDDKHLSLSLALPGFTTEDEPKLELNLISSMEHIRSKEDSLREPNASTLKLFGRTLMIPDSNRQFAARAGVDMDHRSSQHMLSESNYNAMNLDSGKLAEKAINGGFPTNGTWSVCFTPACYCWPPSYGNEANSAGEAQVIRMPLLPFYANMPFPCAYTQQLMWSRGDLNPANLQSECSGTGSNSGHEGDNAVESKQDECSDDEEAGFSVVQKARKLNNGSATSCTKGFVPYRRCDSEEKAKSPNSAEESVGDG